MSENFFRIWVFLSESPLLWLSVTLCVYALALHVYRAAGSNPFLLPVLTAVSVIVLILLATDTPYETYFEGAQFIHFLVGPATVALAIPLYSQTRKLKEHWKPILAALLIGTVVAMFSTALIAWALGGSSEMIIFRLYPNRDHAYRYGVGGSLWRTAVTFCCFRSDHRYRRNHYGRANFTSARREPPDCSWFFHGPIRTRHWHRSIATYS